MHLRSVVIGVGASSLAWAWGNEGHEIAAIIAADNLTPAARQQVAAILGTSTDVEPLEKAMAIASIRADTEFREQDRSTAAWHFIDICLQDSKSDIPARCPGGACATAKLDEFAEHLKNGNCDKWGGDGDLAFVIHLVADLHQPLHTATDADRGGNCITVESKPPARNLHNAWDTAVVYELEDTVDSGSPEATAHKLEQIYASQKDADSWKPGGTEDIAWESHEVARSQIYGALGIPVEPCQADNNSCTNAPKGSVDLDSAYMSKASTIAGEQLAKAGFRLASLLNGLWPSGSPITNCAGLR
jgi:S1/P1 Nuclease